MRPDRPGGGIPLIAGITAEEQHAWLLALRAAMPDESIVLPETLTAEQRATVTLAIVANPDPAALAALPNLRWVQSLWAGVERLVASVDRADLAIVRLIDPQLAATMAEAVLAWTLYLHRDMPQYAAQQRERRWHQRPLRRAQDTRIGLLGVGELGTAAARSLRNVGFKVSGWSRRAKSIEGIESFHGDAGLIDILAQSDIVVCLLPLTANTRGLLNATRFAQMKPGAGLINFARGAIVVDYDLCASLDQGALSHAVLDVFATEPLAENSPLWRHPAITVLPHISAPTNRMTASRIVAANIARYRATGQIPEVVDRARGY